MIKLIVAIITSKNHCFLIKPTTMFKRVFIENEEIVIFMCSIHSQKDTSDLVVDYQSFTNCTGRIFS